MLPSARLAAIWSMIPQWAPTKSFSAFWPSCASLTSSRFVKLEGLTNGSQAGHLERGARGQARAEWHIRADAEIEPLQAREVGLAQGPGDPLHVVQPVTSRLLLSEHVAAADLVVGALRLDPSICATSQLNNRLLRDGGGSTKPPL